MDPKWFVLIFVLAFAAFIYARGMRASGASWGEVIFPWGYRSPDERPDRGQKRGGASAE
jgi:hypothetical protein